MNRKNNGVGEQLSTAGIARFMDKVLVTEGCHVWLGNIHTNGYGTMIVNRKRRYAHRLAYTIANGPIPVGLYVCHKCDNHACVNPAHLFAGTQKDNIQDMDRKGRRVNSPLHGESHHRAKLNEEQVRSIRAEYDSGIETTTSLGDKYRVSRGTIQFIGTRQTWRHLK